jgi:hypothetical protein
MSQEETFKRLKKWTHTDASDEFYDAMLADLSDDTVNGTVRDTQRIVDACLKTGWDLDEWLAENIRRTEFDTDE